MLNRSLAVLTNPSVIPENPNTNSCLLESRNCWLPFLAPFPTHHSVWFNVCVDVIALGWKGLASNDAFLFLQLIVLTHFVPVELFILEIKKKWKFLWLTLVAP
uniref:Uncharacterized protein n=3 Tax=Canis lupus TaxID=9612 RepID=A0A8P0PJ62_CANLF